MLENTLEITVNGIKFIPRPDCAYRNNYASLLSLCDKPERWPEIFPGAQGLTRDFVQKQILRHLILNDIWFVVYFVLAIPSANHPFVVKMCKEFEDGPKTRTLDCWSRGHFKSSIITKAGTIAYHLRYPEHATIIFSYKKPAAEKFLASIKQAYESDFLKKLFPEILYDNPDHDSPSWSLQNGITINRKNKTRTEPTIQASGLTEGMVTGMHAEVRIYDDVETNDMANSPDVMNDCFAKFEMSSFLGTKTDADIERVVGTFYHWEGPLAQIQRLKDSSGNLLYFSRIVPGTDDGQPNGKPVFWSQKILDDEKTKSGYYSQILCDPVPRLARKLNPDYLQLIPHNKIPRDVYKFIVLDPAGSDGGGDCWAMHLVGVQPKRDDIGASNVYIMDSCIENFSQGEAVEAITRMYINGGIILRVGVEKVGQSTAEIHVANALLARGKRISVDNETLTILRPGGRKKQDRVEIALEFPLNNNKLFISTNVPEKYRARLRQEMEKFPYYHYDGLDAFSYIYDILKEYRFPAASEEEKVYTRAVEITAGTAGY